MALDAWDIYERLSTLDSDSLSDAQRDLVSVCDLRQAVNSGGFDVYFCAWGGNSAPIAIHALPILISPEWGALLLEAVRLFGDPYPSGPDERFDYIEAHGLSQALGELDTRFYALESATDADGLLNAHVNAHPAAWA